ncbi:MAG: 2-C-methyl-D-erythritol 4-phosphate cytidylyltransferase [Ruminococcaceae bacterium]|nr:2-C-methyl-D-erythritol 4-phosphate cytidylyltransferase [Oscillospiraceae bacterium]
MNNSGENMIFAGICAGGQGTRFKTETNSETPKQFLLLDGKPIISYSVDSFLRCEEIEKVFVAVSEDYIDHCGGLFSDPRVKIVKGGNTRSETVALLVGECEKYSGTDSSEDILATHDAARPFVTVKAIRRAVEAAKKYGASGTALNATDTVLQCQNGFVCAAPPRSEMYLAQTPQCFKIGLFNDVWNKLTDSEKAEATDVCGMFCRAGIKVRIVEGDRECFKITVREDMDRAEKYLASISGCSRFP